MNIAVILAGGRGLRIGGPTPKQMLLLGNKPVISWSVDTFHKLDIIDRIIIVSEKSLINDLKSLFSEKLYHKISAFIEGGKERSDSSYNAIISYDFDDQDIILFHDAARPFVSELIINEMIEKVKLSDACGTYVQSTDTIAIIRDSVIESIPERKSVYSAQTPQGFKYHIIKKAHQIHEEQKQMNITDDVSLVVNMGFNVSFISGSYNNIKITTEFDLKFAEFLISGGYVC